MRLRDATLEPTVNKNPPAAAPLCFSNCTACPCTDGTSQAGDVDPAECADFALHVSLIVFLTIILVSCVYVCRKPTRRKYKMMSVEVQTDDIEIYTKDGFITPSSTPPTERPTLKRHLSEQIRHTPQLSAELLKNHIPPSPLATSDLATSVCSLQSSSTSSHPIRNPKRILRKSATVIAFPTNTMQYLLTSDSYKRLTSNNNNTICTDAKPQTEKRRRITVAAPPTNFQQNLLQSNNLNLGSNYKYTYKPISAVFSTSDGNLGKRVKEAARKTEELRFVTRRVD